MGAGGHWVARASAQAMVVCLALGALLLAGCGDDEPQPEPMGEPAECVSGTVFTCFDSLAGCSGRRVCTSGMLGPCVCGAQERDASQDMPDGSMIGDSGSTDGSQIMPDASDDPEPDASEPGDEDCENGEDDDDDGDVDCADDDCTRSTCVPEAPDDFEGPFLTFIGGSDAPSCSGAYADEGPTGSAGLIAPPADCSTCTCGSTTNSCATFVNLEAGGNNSCAGGCSNTMSEACAEKIWPCIDGDSSANVRAIVPASAGSCSPSEQDPDIEPPAFAQHAQTCAPDRELERDGCERDELCAPRTPFDGVYCVAREGAHDCPDGPYSERHLLYGGIDDDRACTACACDRDCEYTVELFPDADDTCSGDPETTLSIESPNVSEQASSCEDAPAGPGNTLRASFSVSGTGACTASGGQAQGSATGTDPITFCCLD